MEGNVIFSQIMLTEPGFYVFYIREKTPSGNGWITDRRIYTMTVTVTEDERGLRARVDYPDGFPMFLNLYGNDGNCDNGPGANKPGAGKCGFCET
jgi:pilin isopeptide linkage protein